MTRPTSITTGAGEIVATFSQRGVFAACEAAEKWCADNGISVGTMQRRSPRGLVYGNWIISKWGNLLPDHIAALDGRMIGDMRDGPVYVRIKQRPELGIDEARHAHPVRGVGMTYEQAAE